MKLKQLLSVLCAVFSKRQLSFDTLKVKKRLYFVLNKSHSIFSEKKFTLCSINSINTWFTDIKCIYFLDEGNIHLSYSTSANHYGYLTCVKYKKHVFTFNRSNENCLLEITAHKTLSHCFSFNISLIVWQSRFLKTRQTRNYQFLEGWSITVTLLHCIYIFMKKLMYSQSMRNLPILRVIVFNQLGSWLRDYT